MEWGRSYFEPCDKMSDDDALKTEGNAGKEEVRAFVNQSMIGSY